MDIPNEVIVTNNEPLIVDLTATLFDQLAPWLGLVGALLGTILGTYLGYKLSRRLQSPLLKANVRVAVLGTIPVQSVLSVQIVNSGTYTAKVTSVRLEVNQNTIHIVKGLPSTIEPFSSDYFNYDLEKIKADLVRINKKSDVRSMKVLFETATGKKYKSKIEKTIVKSLLE